MFIIFRLVNVTGFIFVVVEVLRDATWCTISAMYMIWKFQNAGVIFKFSYAYCFWLHFEMK